MEKRVALIHMPWGALERPALGVSLLQAGLERHGITADVVYLNMTFADFIGVERYQWVTHELPHIAFAGEWVFSEALYGSDPARDAAYTNEILRTQWRLPARRIAELTELRRFVEPFLAHALALRWDDVDIVGFTSTFEQNLASLALARRLAAAQPHLAIAFGGANWEGPMGIEYHRRFPFVDYVCSGEADESFPALVLAHRAGEAGRELRLREIRGIVFRCGGATVGMPPARPVEPMDSLPIPDFSTYFAARSKSSAAQQVAPVLLFESSRGCWWGAKSHCTFCGLNGHSMGFRSKSPQRFLHELGTLVERWRCPTLEAVDNILDMKYFESVLPALERMHLPGEIFYEIKANLKRHHVAALARAGITRIQPGIESLSTHILRLMRKGTTMLRNVQLLKWCREYGVAVDWNLLYGFPGERDEDYATMLDVLPKIRHLPLAAACGPIRLDRFSPYWQQPGAFGLQNLRPIAPYRLLYPLRDIELDRIAYYFDFDYARGNGPSAIAAAVVDLLESLRDGGDRGTLLVIASGAELYLQDTRPGAAVPTLRLSPYERTIVECLDEVRSVATVMRALHAAHPGDSFAEDDVRRYLDDLVRYAFALREGEHYLGLALMPAALRPRLEAASRRELGGLALERRSEAPRGTADVAC